MEKLASINKEQQKELYVATLVHDLKNPLNAQIVAMEQLYKEKFGGLTGLQKEVLSDVIKSSKFMKELLSSLLYVYKFENGEVKLNKTPVDIDNLIKICLRDITPLSDENCVFIEYINITKQNILLCDENYIRRVISNMLNNIVRYSYKNTKAAVIFDEDNLHSILKFKNCASPIPEDLKPFIFDKYNSGYNRNSGTGLGLYFCKKAVEAHDGLIELNTNGSDIEFCIKIPKMQKNKNNIMNF